MQKQSSEVFSKILLATDGSDGARLASEVASRIAKAFDSEVTILSAIPSLSATAAPLEGEYYSRLVNKADDNADAAAAVFKKAGVSATEKEIPQGSASVVGRIVETAAEEKAGLIVMGTRGLGGFRRAVLGSVSSAVAAHAGCATLVVRSTKKGAAGGDIKKVLVAIDDSQNAQRALEAAVELANRFKAELRITHVVYVPMFSWSMGIPGSTSAVDQIEEDAENLGKKLLTKAVKFAKSNGAADVKEELVTDLTAPAQAIVRIAERTGTDVIVMGTRGNGGFKKLLMGSVANSVLHYAGCSVLVTR